MNHRHNSTIRSHRTRFVAACLAACLLCSLAACGQRGPLYLPDQEIGTTTPAGEDEDRDEETDGAATER